MTIIATAGHVDHGKSALVFVLTGTNPDRLAEERDRGLTIDIGFARLQLQSGEVSFVDLPGHVRFIKNMLAGATGCECCLFVVAATDGWKPQSEEHLRILDLLGVRDAVVAVTKIDLVDPMIVELAREECRERLDATSLRGSEIVEVSAITGQGLDDLRAALERMVARLPSPIDIGRPRLWIDRAFSVAGQGTVVTGTLSAGSLEQGATMTVEPSTREVRIRQLQTHGREVTVAEPVNGWR